VPGVQIEEVTHHQMAWWAGNQLQRRYGIHVTCPLYALQREVG
jgi:hypothetical protein